MRVLDLDLVFDLDSAVETEQLELRYQPEIDLASGAVVGMQALLRWAHPRRGVLYPARSLVAEASGAVPRVDRWALERAVEEVARWQRLRSSPVTRLWIDVPAARVFAPDFAGSLLTLLRAEGVEGCSLGLTLPESVLAPRRSGGPPHLLRTLGRLHDAGVGLAAGNVSAWYAGLRAGMHLPLDAVVLNHRWIRDLDGDLPHDGILPAVIELAHASGMYVVADDVQSWAEGARLCELGCDRALGDLFCAPQPAEQARRMVATGVGWCADASDEKVSLRVASGAAPASPVGPASHAAG